MPIVEAQDSWRVDWDEFIKIHAADGGLLQSWGWGELQKAVGNKIWRLVLLTEQGSWQAVVLAIQTELAFEYNYLYCPRGPVLVDKIHRSQIEELLTGLRNIAADQKCFMIRLDPAWPLNWQPDVVNLGWRKSDKEIQPRCNMVVDIKPTEKELLISMKPKTRYNISLAQKHGVIVRISEAATDFEIFWELMKQTAKRDGFRPHLKEHYKKIWEVFKPTGEVELVLAEYNRRVVAAALVTFFGPVSTYLHGVSADLYREVMAPYLLHWQVMAIAKQHNCSFYDLGGINGQSWSDAKWVGLTRFKTGFAPTTPVREYIGGYELILNPIIYAAYKFIRQLRD